VLLEKAKVRVKGEGLAGVLLARSSILTPALLTTARCSRGTEGVSAGRAEEKDHSSSSLDVCAGAWKADEVGGGDFCDVKLAAPRAAKGSEAAAAAG
jgi:hypothetical protein